MCGPWSDNKGGERYTEEISGYGKDMASKSSTVGSLAMSLLTWCNHEGVLQWRTSIYLSD